jgi:hypothetical protein
MDPQENQRSKNRVKNTPSNVFFPRALIIGEKHLCVMKVEVERNQEKGRRR